MTRRPIIPRDCVKYFPASLLLLVLLLLPQAPFAYASSWNDGLYPSNSTPVAVFSGSFFPSSPHPHHHQRPLCVSPSLGERA